MHLTIALGIEKSKTTIGDQKRANSRSPIRCSAPTHRAAILREITATLGTSAQTACVSHLIFAYYLL